MNTTELRFAKSLAPAAVDGAVRAAAPAWGSRFRSLEKRVFHAAWRALRRMPLARNAEFSNSHGPRVAWLSAWPKVGAVALPLLCVLGGAEAGVPSAALAAVGVALSALGLYLLAWIVGMRRLLREGGIAVTLKSIEIDLGLRGRASLPMHAVKRCRALSAARVPAGAAVLRLSPSEEPNVLIELAGAVAIDTVRFGQPLAARAVALALYVDEPAGFVAAVEHALPRGQRASA